VAELATHLVLGQEVQGGDVLVEIEATAQHLQREEEQVRLNALTPQIEVLRTAIAAEEQALREARHAARVALDEARARHREAEVAARTAEEEAGRVSAAPPARPRLLVSEVVQTSAADHVAHTAGQANGNRVRQWFQAKKAGWYAVLADPQMPVTSTLLD
jgi:multidrug resistance efflux pump